MLYSYKDCWNYALSQKKIEQKNEFLRDLIIICQKKPTQFWFYFSQPTLTTWAYLSICQKIDKYWDENCPAPYLGQGLGFYRLFFRTQKGVFLPQRETELIIEKLLELVAKYRLAQSLHVLDIGTGCGNLAISLAEIKPSWQVVAVDINPQAIKLAQTNAQIYGLKNIKFLQSNLFSRLDRQKKFDIIISNPPYLNQTEYQQLPPRVKEQPKNALLASENGYFFYQQIFQQARSFLQPKFFLLVEIGRHSPEKLLKIVRKFFPLVQVRFFLDWTGQYRVMSIYKI